MFILLLFSFISGLVTILAPCIWPLLPIVLSVSSTGGHRKPLGITFGIIISFAFFTLAISYLVMAFHFDPNILRFFAVLIIGFLGITMLVPYLSERLEGFVGGLSSTLATNNNTRTGFVGGLITGITLGAVWSPCAGPILATIATLGATQSVNLQAILVTVSYCIGVGIPLFIFSYFGARLFKTNRFLTKYTGRVQQIFGIILILMAFAIYTNYDKIIQAKLLDYFPAYSNLLYKFESNPAVKTQLDILKGKNYGTKIPINNSGSLPYLGRASEFEDITNWINSKPLTIAELKGKVVLVDFWTYTCINCIRTLPHVTSWYDKYKDKGFVVVGVHTPEFEFEKNTQNVEKAISQFGIHYPVAQDNNYATWNAYDNQYWPAEYLIDVKGNIRRYHFGEGEYDQTEKAIRILLEEKGSKVKENMSRVNDETPSNSQDLSPETYIGASRMQYLFPNGRVEVGKYDFKLDSSLQTNSFSLGGTWNIQKEEALSGKNATLIYNFFANKVYLVMRPADGGSKVKITLDGKELTPENAGIDVKNGLINIDQDRLYNLVDLKGNSGNHILKLEFLTPGTKVYAFTFG